MAMNRKTESDEALSVVLDRLRVLIREEGDAASTSIVGKPLEERFQLAFGHELKGEGISEVDHQMLEMWAERLKNDPSAVPSLEDKDYIRDILRRA